MFSVICSVPTIGVEAQLEQEIHAGKQLNVENDEQYKQVVSDTFLEEASMYVKSISIKKEDGQTILIDIQRLSYKDRLEVVGRFSSKLLKNIVAYTNYVQQQTDKIELINFKHADVVYQKRLNIGDGSFFVIS